MDKLPDTPLLISGCLGGPSVIFINTPMRNALTLGSQDARSGFRALYTKVFRGGALAGWTGGVAPAVVACPQFLALSPVYHFLNNNAREGFGVASDAKHALAPSLVASVGAGLVETWLTFGSQSRNAQMAYNKSFVQFSSVVDGSRRSLRVNPVYCIWGPGAGAMAVRNVLSIAGMRVLSPWLKDNVPAGHLGANTRATLCDIFSSLVVCPISAPIHQLFNFLCTTPEAVHMSRSDRWGLAQKFLTKQYFVPLPRDVVLTTEQDIPRQEYSWRISKVALRDLGMRGLYISSVFTLFMSIERFLCTTMRS
mmetsp:Transcript_62838/g.141982  ORF Transcript_62838/g.141982 Transcript_62838/m.141982 type:complete len:309 (+) Transcript_62838:90-1016(+)